jgi:hypothetical protein
LSWNVHRAHSTTTASNVSLANGSCPAWPTVKLAGTLAVAVVTYAALYALTTWLGTFA